MYVCRGVRVCVFVGVCVCDGLWLRLPYLKTAEPLSLFLLCSVAAASGVVWPTLVTSGEHQYKKNTSNDALHLLHPLPLSYHSLPSLCV